MSAIHSPGKVLEDILTGNFGPEKLQELVAPAAAIFMALAAGSDLGATFFNSPAGTAPTLENITALADALKA